MTSFPAATTRAVRTPPPPGATGPRGPPPGARAPPPENPHPSRSRGSPQAWGHPSLPTGGGRGRNRPEASAAQSSAAPPLRARGLRGACPAPAALDPRRPRPPATPPTTPSPRLMDRTGTAKTQHHDAEATGAPPPRFPYIDAGPPGARRLFQKPPEPSGRTLPNRRRGRALAPAPWPRPRPSPGRARARPERPTPNRRRARARARLSAPAQLGTLAKVSRLPGPPPPERLTPVPLPPPRACTANRARAGAAELAPGLYGVRVLVPSASSPA